jgi:hypothetical protein
MRFAFSTTVALAALLLTAGPLAHADLELDRLKEAYARDLQKLYQRHSQAGRLTEAAKVLAELRAIGVTEVDMPSPPPEQFFVNTAWRTAYGTVFEFQPHQRGVRSYNNADLTAFSWKSLPDGLIEVTGPFRRGEPEVTWYFRFESNTEAYYGPHKDEVIRLLQKQR